MYNNPINKFYDQGEKMYVDVILFVNFIIDYLLLNITYRFSRLKTSRGRLLIGAAIGTAYTISVFFPPFRMFLSPAIKFAVSILMIIAAFAPEKFKDFFKLLAVFYIVTFAFSGASFSLFYFTGRGSVYDGAYYIRDFPVSILITAFAIGYLLLVYTWDYIQNRILNDELTYSITIIIDERQAVINAILDTGNSLRDPISNLPVLVVEYDALHDILPDEVSVLYQNSKDIDINCLYKLVDNADWKLKIRLIPFTSIGRQNGMLIGIKPDSIRICTGKYARETDRVIVGICGSKISKDGQYKALLYPEILR